MSVLPLTFVICSLTLAEVGHTFFLSEIMFIYSFFYYIISYITLHIFHFFLHRYHYFFILHCFILFYFILFLFYFILFYFILFLFLFLFYFYFTLFLFLFYFDKISHFHSLRYSLPSNKNIKISKYKILNYFISWYFDLKKCLHTDRRNIALCI